MPAKTDNALAELYHIEDKDDIQLVSVFSEETSGYQDHPEVLKEYLDFVSYVTMIFQQVTQSDEYNNILHCLLQNPKWLAEFREIIEEMKVSAFNADTIEEVIEEENARICQEMAYDFQSDAFTGYLQYSVNSVPPKPEEYLSLQDRELLMEDFRSQLLKAPGKVDECLQTWYPD